MSMYTSMRHDLIDKNCSAVAEIGDRLATIDRGRKLGRLCPFRRELCPHITQCGIGRRLPSYQVASWSIKNRLATKIWRCAHFGGAGSLSNTMCLGWGLPPYQVASSSIQPFGHNSHLPKIGEGCAPLREGEPGPYLLECGQGRGLTSYQVSSTVWRNAPTLQPGQTDIAYIEPFYKPSSDKTNDNLDEKFCIFSSPFVPLSLSASDTK